MNMGRALYRTQIWLDRHPRLRRRLRLIERELRRRRLFRDPSSEFAFLLSYPRSGNHWLRYIVEVLGERSTSGTADGFSIRDSAINGGDTPIHYRLGSRVKPGSPLVVKRHLLKDWDDRSRPLLWLVRNPIEAVASHANYCLDDELLAREVASFIRLCLAVDEYPGEVLVVRFSELVSENVDVLGNVISRTFKFLGISLADERLQEFLTEVSAHRQRSVQILAREPLSTRPVSSSEQASQVRRRVTDLFDQRRVERTSPALESALRID